MALPDFNTALDLLKKGATLEAQEQISSLREKHVSLREENINLREENQKLKKQLSSQLTLTYEAPYYWKIEGTVKDGPFCQQCYDSSNELVRLQKDDSYGEGAWECKKCKNQFKDSNYSPRPLMTIL